MRIVVNDIAASKTGALAILTDFYEYVKENAKEHEWIFLTGIDVLKECEHIRVIVLKEVKRSQKDRLYFDLVSGSKYIESLKPDVVFSLQNTLTRGKIRTGDGRICPQVLYIHQPLGFQKIKKFSFLKKEEREYAVYQYLIGALIDSSAKRASHCIVQTDWMKAAVAKKNHIDPDKISRVLPDIADLSDYKVEEEFKSNLFFFPSGEILYKNHECVIKAAQILNNRGITDFKVRFTLKGLSDVTKRTYEDPYNNIEWTGRVTRSEVIKQYSQSTLIFPSYIETFGVPLAEARQMNTLILASDCPFSHEVLAGYENVRYFNPFNENELADLMEQVIKKKITAKENKDSLMKESLLEKQCSYGKIVKIIEETNTI